MAYAYWHSKRRSDTAVFDLFFRRNPFAGEFCLFAGLEECLKFLDNFHYSEQGESRDAAPARGSSRAGGSQKVRSLNPGRVKPMTYES